MKDLLLPLTHTDGDEGAITAALQLAAHFGSHVTALAVTEMLPPVPSEWGTFPASLYVGMYDDACRASRELAARVRARFERETAATEVRLEEGMLLERARTAALHARYADLAVMTSAVNSQARPAVERLFVELLMHSGRPVLLVPPGQAPVLPAKRVVIAWQPTREATRAVHDALPLLQTAQSIEVLVIDPQIGDRGHGEQPGADIAAHLARHGLAVTVVNQPRDNQSVATAILRHAFETGAQMLVAGGYSHTRLREQILGGATRELLAAAHLPVLFSH